ncbi:FAD-dependent oxidoreductase [Taibaiella chishuiensis]|uniref:2-polyprenyl-6-methoxyphenol hydroxylase-like FAD-dependent oxidoreductase n=1 Tax=Taibaiella chishuiensis TaxID=1434707 RepID=A0A2P8CV16_9BACT|nr:NAD(P)/FAD-dependent oxidoreductase [Taibaiella chishuiensis]PSK88805.1 2-polyprenyl-6-methoxyphenol hydroxylase-like FAD-dependent oxidoreductase [Taibaiella chishuiensis]
MVKELLYGKNVAIIGAGPAGLTLANLLQQQGARVRVYEREPDALTAARGGTMELHAGAALKALAQTGLEGKVALVHRPESTRLKMYDKYKALVLEVPPGAAGGHHPEADRKEICLALAASLAPGTLQWGRHFKTLAIKDNRYELQFMQGQSETADIVIGADGARSSIRPFLTPVQAMYSGSTLIHGVTADPVKTCPELYAMVQQGTLFAVGNGKSIIVQEKGNSSLEFYCSIGATPEGELAAATNFQDRAAVVQQLETLYAGWHPVFYELFASARAFVPRAVYATPATQHWKTQPNLTLIGDAAHVIPSFASAGVNMAMLDACELAAQLGNSSHKSIGAAISAYEQEMLARTARVQLEVRDSEHIFHAHTSTASLY